MGFSAAGHTETARGITLIPQARNTTCKPYGALAETVEGKPAQAGVEGALSVSVFIRPLRTTPAVRTTGAGENNLHRKDDSRASRSLTQMTNAALDSLSGHIRPTGLRQP